MARVIKKIPIKEKKVLCKNCGCTIAYVNKDVKSKFYSDPWGFSETLKWVNCPGCKQSIDL